MCIMYWKDGEHRVLVKMHKSTFFVLYLLISPTKSNFSLGKTFWWGGGGGVHGKVCWLIAYSAVLYNHVEEMFIENYATTANIIERGNVFLLELKQRH